MSLGVHICVCLCHILYGFFQLPACLNVSISGLVTSIEEERAVFLLSIILVCFFLVLFVVWKLQGFPPPLGT